MKSNKQAVAFRWGQLIAAIETARSALAVADRSSNLLTADYRQRLALATDLLSGIEQHAWSSMDKT